MPERSTRGGPQAAIATNTYWRSLSDEQLLDISFTTSDPESLTGLLEEVPDTSGALQSWSTPTTSGGPKEPLSVARIVDTPIISPATL